MPTAYLDANTYGIGQLIEERRQFVVPDHQRHYAWTDDIVEQFLDDVISAMQEKRDEYFLGLVVLVASDGRGPWTILDGQQRLATSTMVYSAARQWLSSNNFEDDATQISTSYVGIRQLGGMSVTPRITMNLDNRKAFQELVVNKCDDDLVQRRYVEAGRYSSDRLLIEATAKCRARIRVLAHSGGATLEEQARRLYDLAQFMRDSVRVVCLDVPSTTNAYVIFEALNDRGLDLSVLDLVKNHMFGLAGGQLSDVQTEWLRMVTELGDRAADDFLKVFWTSKFGRIQRGRLFDSWKSEYNNQSKVLTVAPVLTLAARRYAALDVPNDETWGDYSQIFRDRLGILKDLGNQQLRAVLLAAIDDVLSPEQMERLLGHLITFTVRYQVVGKRRTGALEITGARIAKQITDGILDTPAKIWKELIPLVPIDEEFTNDLSSLVETSALKARYLIAELEQVARQQRHGDYGSELHADYQTLTLEHVLPRNPSAVWNVVLSDDSELRMSHVYRLGNLCLMTERLNRRAASAGFAEKRSTWYQNSTLLTTSEIGEGGETWDRAAIEGRQKRLAALGTIAWPLPAV